jgi:hypothetical protein
MPTTPRRPEHQVLRRAFSTQTPRKIRDPLRQNSCPTKTANPQSFFESVLTRTESQAYDFSALGKHEGNRGLEDERPAAYLCFGTLHAPHCANQVFVYLAEELPRLFPEIGVRVVRLHVLRGAFGLIDNSLIRHLLIANGFADALLNFAHDLISLARNLLFIHVILS